MRIAIIGGGCWGTVLGIVTSRAGHLVSLWARNPAIVEEINRDRVNSRYLESIRIPSSVIATENLHEALNGARIVILASPSHATRELLARMYPSLLPEMLFVSGTKGVEAGTGKRVSEILREVIEHSFEPHFVCLSGPSFAKEVAARHPTAVLAAGITLEDSQIVQRELSFDNLRIYSSTDVVGAELGGSVKNIIAIAAGMLTGLNLGTNSVAALVTRGLAETTRLALHEGGRRSTLMGLAGLGDMVLTCTGSLSRNRRVGFELARGKSLNEIVGAMREVAEGVNTTVAIKRLANRRGIAMPITEEVHSVLYEGDTVLQAVERLMKRPLRAEFESESNMQ